MLASGWLQVQFGPCPLAFPTGYAKILQISPICLCQHIFQRNQIKIIRAPCLLPFIFPAISVPPYEVSHEKTSISSDFPLRITMAFHPRQETREILRLTRSSKRWRQKVMKLFNIEKNIRFWIFGAPWSRQVMVMFFSQTHLVDRNLGRLCGSAERVSFGTQCSVVSPCRVQTISFHIAILFGYAGG